MKTTPTLAILLTLTALSLAHPEKTKRQDYLGIEPDIIQKTQANSPTLVENPENRVCEALQRGLETLELDILNPNGDERDVRAHQTLLQRKVNLLGTMRKWECAMSAPPDADAAGK